LKFPNSCINSLLYHFLQFLFAIIPPNFILEAFLQKQPAISLFNVQWQSHSLLLLLKKGKEAKNRSSGMLTGFIWLRMLKNGQLL